MKQPLLWIFILCGCSVVAQTDSQYRPAIHFTPAKGWMNDPNGMIYNNGVYHLFYQHNPDSAVWGPMHWGHATSKNLVQWKREPIALFPDSLGTIFSGSVVLDKNNSSGFGKGGKAPLVAIFTHHDAEAEKAGSNSFQHQSLAYSNDNGKKWIKYKGNPVLKSPGIRDFRDPKVIWHEGTSKWIMSLAAVDKVIFYSSTDLKNWTKESDFGEQAGAHGGVWECPDLFPLEFEGKAIWVLIVNINPGGPNKGSATQYFLGDFDGKHFSPFSSEIKWLDYGPDEYAGVTWSNTGRRKIFLGWMSNWLYANIVPTETWRSAMTIPRELKIAKTGETLYLASMPCKELLQIKSTPLEIKGKSSRLKTPCQVDISSATEDFSIKFFNDEEEEISIGFNKAENSFYIDRTKSGKADFYKEFAGKYTAPRFSNNSDIKLSLIIDVTSVELFADDGLTVMTAIFFPGKPYTTFAINNTKPVKIMYSVFNY